MVQALQWIHANQHRGVVGSFPISLPVPAGDVCCIGENLQQHQSDRLTHRWEYAHHKEQNPLKYYVFFTHVVFIIFQALQWIHVNQHRGVVGSFPIFLPVPAGDVCCIGENLQQHQSDRLTHRSGYAHHKERNPLKYTRLYNQDVTLENYL